jgi:WhiB family redox-sensing transcriptional regulator
LNWFQEAICIGKDPELFFPIGSTGPAAIQAEKAKAVCVGCPVREECLDWALTTGQDAGVWGGLSEEERRALTRARRRERLAVG